MEDALDRQNRLTVPPLLPNSVAVIGCGGIGTMIAQACLMAGVKRVHVSDNDVLEETNLNRLPYSKKMVGSKKVDCLKAYLDLIADPLDKREVLGFDAVESDEDLWWLEGAEFVFITADRGAARELVSKYCTDHRIPYINVGYDGNHISLYIRMFTSDDEDPDEGGYTVVPSWVAPTYIISGLAMYYMAYPLVMNRPFSADILKMLGFQEFHKCEECGFQSPNPWEVEGHVKWCATCRKSFHKKEEYEAHIDKKCDDCGLVTCSTRVFNGHKTRKCPYCGYKTCMNEAYGKHLMETHPEKLK